MRKLLVLLCCVCLYGCTKKEKTAVTDYYTDLTDTIYYLGTEEDFNTLYEHGTGVIVVFDETGDESILKEIEQQARDAGLVKVMLAEKDTIDYSLDSYPSIITVVQGESSVFSKDDIALETNLEEVKEAQSDSSDSGCDTECVFDPTEN